MTEETAPSPCSKKGRARLRGWELIQDRIQAGSDIVDGRPPDFIGKGVNSSIMSWKSIEHLTQSGRRVRSLQRVGDPATTHTYAYARDVAQGLLVLDQDKPGRGTSLVHLPVVKALTDNEIGTILSELLDCRVVVRPIRPLLMKAASAVSTQARSRWR